MPFILKPGPFIQKRNCLGLHSKSVHLSQDSQLPLFPRGEEGAKRRWEVGRAGRQAGDQLKWEGEGKRVILVKFLPDLMDEPKSLK